MEDYEYCDIGQAVHHPRKTRGFEPGSRGVIVQKYLNGYVVRWDSGPLKGKTMDMSSWELDKA
jgi:hypothetical protein